MSGCKIFQKEAKKIAEKLKAVITAKAKHDWADIYVDEALVGSFGIRRGKKEPHGHIQKQIWVSATDAERLANCTMSLDEWIKASRKKGKIAALPEPLEPDKHSAATL